MESTGCVQGEKSSHSNDNGWKIYFRCLKPHIEFELSIKVHRMNF